MAEAPFHTGPATPFQAGPGAGALFHPGPGRDVWLPTEQSRGPWSPAHLHGGPVAALLARAVEAAPTDGGGPFHVARVTVELQRPVRVDAPVSVASALARPGRKVQLVEATLTQGGRVVSQARALRIRTAPVPILVPIPVPGTAEAEVDPAQGPDRRPPGPDEGRRVPSPRGGAAGFHTTGAELRFVEGAFAEPGPATVWVRLAVPVVPGEEPSPLQRAVAAADFGNGVASPLRFDQYLFINPDLTVHLSRPPVGEWVGLQATMRPEADGVGLAQSRLWDRDGVVGRSLQSLFIEGAGAGQ
ncbi:MAG: thioesterase family protein [Acidimicrobiales bacterium]